MVMVKKPTMLDEKLKNEVLELAIPAEPIESHPKYDAKKHELMKKGLISIMGEKYVSDEPWVTQAYSRDYSTIFTQMRPEFVVIPGSVEDVQAIVKLANRLKFPVIPVGTSLSGTCKANRPATVILDVAKRMKRIITLDAKNMYAVIESGVTYAELHAEAIKKGLTHHGAPSSGSQSKVLPNVIGIGACNAKGYRYGVGPDQILGLEMVLPTGDILWVGSPAMPGAGYFWGEGPGPDLRGIVTGNGSYGSSGIVTKMAYKLHPWPGPNTWPAESYLPHIKTKLPADKHRPYLIKFPSYRKLIDALYEIGKSEIGYAIHSLTPHQIAGWYCRSNKQFYEQYFKEKYFHKWAPNAFLHLVALTSTRQLAYEEKVLKQIMKEYGGELVPQDERLKDFLETTGIEWGYADVHGCRTMRYTGTYTGFDGTEGPLDQLAEVGKKDGWQLQIRDKHHPPLVDVLPYDSIVWPIEFCHYAIQEQSVFPEKAPDKFKKGLDCRKELVEEALRRNDSHGVEAMYTTKETMGMLAKVKQAFDPANVANPPLPMSFFELFEQARKAREKKD